MAMISRLVKIWVIYSSHNINQGLSEVGTAFHPFSFGQWCRIAQSWPRILAAVPHSSKLAKDFGSCMLEMHYLHIVLQIVGWLKMCPNMKNRYK